MEVVVVYDIGKTNKKLFLFDKNLNIVYQTIVTIPEIRDEDDEICEDIITLTSWIKSSFELIKENKYYTIVDVHCTAYGASLVYIDERGTPLLPLYNYLKTYPKDILDIFEEKYGPFEDLCLETASPLLGSLNAGLQLYRIKKEKVELFKNIKWVLHLPQYIYFILKGEIASDITSIGCHTMLWDFKKNDYHKWVYDERLNNLFPPIKSNVGIHDSSAALIPYLYNIKHPFILISTGTWSISLNPFNQLALTTDELKNDTLFYISTSGRSIKASRIFLGNKYEIFLSDQNLSSNTDSELHKNIIDEIINEQVKCTNLIMNDLNINNIYVDGGFSNNIFFMKKLAACYPNKKIFAANVPQASSIGAALSLCRKLNNEFGNNFKLETTLYS